jgi:hypothetical protein
MALEIFHQSVSPVEDASAMQSWKMVGTWALSLRADAGLDSDTITYFKYGQYVRMTNETKQINGTTWYKVQCLKDGQLVEGWITGTYLTDYVGGSSKVLLDEQMDDIFEEHGVELQGIWTLRDKRAAAIAIDDVATAFARELGIDKDEAFRRVFDNLNLLWGVEPESGYLTSECRGINLGGCTSSSAMINFGSLWAEGPYRPEDVAFQASVNNVVHELGHAFANLWWGSDEGPYDDLGDPDNAHLINNDGFQYPPAEAKNMWRQHPEKYASPNEVFADMFLGWVYSEWPKETGGDDRRDYMDENMPEWLGDAVSDE